MIQNQQAYDSSADVPEQLHPLLKGAWLVSGAHWPEACACIVRVF